MRHIKILKMICLSLALSALACASADTKTPPPTCTHFPYATYMVGATPRTLATDIMPVFAGNCAIGTPCHSKGSVNPPMLGDIPGMTTVTAADIRAAVVGVGSKEVTSLQYVVAGAPESSYLMRKVEETNPGCGLMCMSTPATGCATQMPNGGIPLTADTQTMIRDWIKQGAN